MKRRFLNIVGGSIAALIVISGVTFGLVFAQVEPSEFTAPMSIQFEK